MYNIMRNSNPIDSFFEKRGVIKIKHTNIIHCKIEDRIKNFLAFFCFSICTSPKSLLYTILVKSIGGVKNSIRTIISVKPSFPIINEC